MNQASSRLSTTHGHITDCKLLVCMYGKRLVLVRPAASLYSARPLKHHSTVKQWCPNPHPYSDSEPARRSLTLLCWALSRAAEPQILASFVWRGRGSNHQPPACQANAQPLHYPAAVSTTGGSKLSLFLLDMKPFWRYMYGTIFKISIFGHEIWNLKTGSTVGYVLSFYPRGSKLGLFFALWAAIFKIEQF